MNEIEIQRHSFELAKNRLKKFSEKKDTELKIENVKTNGGFLGLGNHKVTGYELNSRLEDIQEHFISVYTTNNNIIKEFREVYNALDALDKDYITSIIANVKAIEKTSNDVRKQQNILKQHNKKLEEQQQKLDMQQAEIEKNVENISTIVNILKGFKESLEEYKHLTDIDKIWNDCKDIQNEINVVSGNIKKFSKKVTEDIEIANNKNKALSDQVNRDLQSLFNKVKSLKEFSSDLSERLEHTATLLDNQIPLIQKADSFSEQLKDVSHLKDVDEIWEQTEKHQSRIKRLEKKDEDNTEKLNELAQTDERMSESIDSNVHDINILKEYKDNLSGVSHLYDVDIIWKDVDEHKSQLIECKKRDEDIVDTIQKNKEEVDENIANAVHTSNAAIETLTKKIKYAYWIAGGSAGLAIVELILLLIKVM